MDTKHDAPIGHHWHVYPVRERCPTARIVVHFNVGAWRQIRQHAADDAAGMHAKCGKDGGQLASPGGPCGHFQDLSENVVRETHYNLVYADHVMIRTDERDAAVHADIHAK